MNNKPSFWHEALQDAGSCWADEANKHKEVDVELGTSIARRIEAWIDTSVQFARDADYWRNRALRAEQNYELLKTANLQQETVLQHTIEIVNDIPDNRREDSAE